MLIQNGADVDHVEKDGSSALNRAAIRGNLNQNSFDPFAIVNKADKMLSFIIFSVGNEKVVDLLLQNGANVNLINKFGHSALHRAVFKGNCEM